MNDLLDDFVGHGSVAGCGSIHEDMDIFADNPHNNNCACCGGDNSGRNMEGSCKKKSGTCHDYAMDSTFISFECEQ